MGGDRVYYNEIDPFCCSWLSNLMDEGLITPGKIDNRSIEDVAPNEFAGYDRCHFFAGIGIWERALMQADWRGPAWTGSCPCQPFSAAGKGGGFADERHLWPAWFHLIQNGKRPEIPIFGEQVTSKDGLAWLDLVQADLEGADYTVWPFDLCAAGFGAPHIRQRLYWVAHTTDAGQERTIAKRNGGAYGLAIPNGGNANTKRLQRSGEQRFEQEDGSAVKRLDNSRRTSDERWRESKDLGCPSSSEQSEIRERERRGDATSNSMQDCRTLPTNGVWRDADWLYCRDGKWRPVEPTTFPLANAGTYRNRIPALRGAGNAIVLAQAQGFIEAVMEVM